MNCLPIILQSSPSNHLLAINKHFQMIPNTSFHLIKILEHTLPQNNLNKLSYLTNVQQHFRLHHSISTFFMMNNETKTTRNDDIGYVCHRFFLISLSSCVTPCRSRVYIRHRFVLQFNLSSAKCNCVLQKHLVYSPRFERSNPLEKSALVCIFRMNESYVCLEFCWSGACFRVRISSANIAKYTPKLLTMVETDIDAFQNKEPVSCCVNCSVLFDDMCLEPFLF
jgi:hypothetical protein